jgi:signal transduction histidine kinase
VLLIFSFLSAFLAHPFLYALFGTHWWLLLACVLAIMAAIAPLFYGQLCRQTETIHQEINKMNMLGNIASGIGHNLNNRFNSLLTLINMYNLKYSQRGNIEGLSSGELKARYSELMLLFKQMKEESLLGFDIAGALSKFAMQPVEPQSFYLEEAVSSAFKLLSYKRELAKITIIKNYSKPGPRLWASLSNIQDVLFQLGDNACDALLEKERQIEKGKLYFDNFTPTITLLVDLKKDSATITVSDNGIGMDKQTLGKMGRPFFSTKSNQNGHLGLGMWAVKRHLEMNASSLTVNSIYGKGTSFSFSLPYLK